MRLPPVEVLRTWPMPNYKDPVTRGNELVMITVILFPIAIGMVILRIWTRLRLSKSFGADDVVLLISVPPTIVSSSLNELYFSYCSDLILRYLSPPRYDEPLHIYLTICCLPYMVVMR